MKNSDVNTMFKENDCTAQVLREAHITLQDDKCNRQKLPFILTNGAIWSVGIAVKDAHKIKVTECSFAAVYIRKSSLTWLKSTQCVRC